VPYDKSTVIWSPDGELVQLSYARRASEKGLSAIGMILDNNTILLAGRTKLDELVETQSKIKIVDNGLYLLASGLSSDSNLLLYQSRLISQRHTLIYGEIIGPEALAKQLGDIMARHTLSGGLRAFGASLLIAGFNPNDKKPKILFVDNGGSYFSARAYASGQDSEKIVSFFREHYKTGISVEGGKKLVLDAINFTITDANKKIKEEDLEFQVIKPVNGDDW
jgi:20S proteasome alpha/beta subunit